MKKKKSCKNCKTIYEGTKCPSCDSQESSESWKGKLIIFKPEQSEIAKKLKIQKPGTYAIKNR